MIVDARNKSAHEMTPRQLTTFIKYLADGSDDKRFYAALFAFVFQFPYTDTDKQPDSIQSQILTNCKSRLPTNNAIFDSCHQRAAVTLLSASTLTRTLRTAEQKSSEGIVCFLDL
jgi:hypothetical protein